MCNKTKQANINLFNDYVKTDQQLATLQATFNTLDFDLLTIQQQTTWTTLHNKLCSLTDQLNALPTIDRLSIWAQLPD
jgi:hypothetical protein